MDREALWNILKTKKVDIEYLLRSKYCKEYNYTVLEDRKLTEEEYKALKTALK